jgi:tight adherence protein C
MLLPLLIFLSVTIGLAGMILLWTPSAAARRVRRMGLGETPEVRWTATVASLVGPFARLSQPAAGWENSALRIRFINAGIRRDDARLIYFGAKTLLPLAFATAAFAMLRVLTQLDGLTFTLYVVLAATIGCYLPNLYLWRRVRVRRREIFENFPDAADLMLVCVEAGLGLDAALTRIAEEVAMKSGALADELHLTNLEMRAGASREQSLRNLALRTGVEEVGGFATMLTQTDRFGTSIGDSLRVFSDDLRHKRQMRAEEAAAKIPTKMLIPLVTCIFPSIIMVILGPAAIQIVHIIGPMLSNNG